MVIFITPPAIKSALKKSGILAREDPVPVKISKNLTNALVFLPKREYNKYAIYLAANDPLLKNNVIFALKGDGDKMKRLATYLKRDNVYLFSGQGESATLVKF